MVTKTRIRSKVANELIASKIYIMPLIAGIIHFVMAGIFLLVGLLMAVNSSAVAESDPSSGGIAMFVGVLMIVGGIFALVTGLLFLWSYKLMKYKKTIYKGSIVSLVLGIIVLVLNFNLIGILGIIAGISGISYAKEYGLKK